MLSYRNYMPAHRRGRELGDLRWLWRKECDLRLICPSGASQVSSVPKQASLTIHASLSHLCIYSVTTILNTYCQALHCTHENTMIHDLMKFHAFIMGSQTEAGKQANKIMTVYYKCWLCASHYFKSHMYEISFNSHNTFELMIIFPVLTMKK